MIFPGHDIMATNVSKQATILCMLCAKVCRGHESYHVTSKQLRYAIVRYGKVCYSVYGVKYSMVMQYFWS